MKSANIMINRIKDESFDESFAEEVKFPITTAAKMTFDAHLVRAPSRATLVRWIRKGKYGIRLQSRRFNGNYQTSVEAINRFIKAVDVAAESVDRKFERRKQQLDHVSAELDRLGM